MTGMIEKKITLDLDRTGVQVRIPVRQGDSLVYRITLSLERGGREFFPDGVIMAELRAILPNGSSVSTDCEIADGRCHVTPGAGFFCVGGPVLCRLILRGEDGAELYSPAFAFDAETTFALDDTAEADVYSRIAELLLQVQEIKKECEKIASTVGNIDVTKGSLATRDYFVVYNASTNRYERVQWSVLRTSMKNFLDGSLHAIGLMDEVETGFVATIPELEDDDYIVVGSHFEALMERVASLEEKVK